MPNELPPLPPMIGRFVRPIPYGCEETLVYPTLEMGRDWVNRLRPAQLAAVVPELERLRWELEASRKQVTWTSAILTRAEAERTDLQLQRDELEMELASAKGREERLREALVRIQQWDMLNPPRVDMASDLAWLRGVVDAALATPTTAGGREDVATDIAGSEPADRGVRAAGDAVGVTPAAAPEPVRGERLERVRQKLEAMNRIGLLAEPPSWYMDNIDNPEIEGGLIEHLREAAGKPSPPKGGPKPRCGLGACRYPYESDVCSICGNPIQNWVEQPAAAQGEGREPCPQCGSTDPLQHYYHPTWEDRVAEIQNMRAVMSANTRLQQQLSAAQAQLAATKAKLAEKDAERELIEQRAEAAEDGMLAEAERAEKAEAALAEAERREVAERARAKLAESRLDAVIEAARGRRGT